MPAVLSPLGCAPLRARVSRRTKTREERMIKELDVLGEKRREISPVLAGSLLRSSPLSVSSPMPSLKQQPQRESGGDKQKYYVNMGDAIRTLREEFPHAFYREPCFDIYRLSLIGVLDFSALIFCVQFYINFRLFFIPLNFGCLDFSTKLSFLLLLLLSEMKFN